MWANAFIPPEEEVVRDYIKAAAPGAGGTITLNLIARDGGR
jgi:hypothetical protein